MIENEMQYSQLSSSPASSTIRTFQEGLPGAMYIIMYSSTY
jgi:hypothetical protein